jgi:hypothetical protein
MSDRDREEEDHEEEENRLQVKVSKYERERQKKALMKRKEQFESETGVLGRQLDGPAFESTPRVIEFKDFGLNEPHLLTIILTNISPAANYFKVLPIEDEFRVIER